MSYFVDKDGRYHGRTARAEATDIEVPGPPRDGRMIWQDGAWQETPATLADKDAPPAPTIESELAALKTKVAALEAKAELVK